MTDTSIEPITVTIAETRKVSGLGTTTIYELIKQRKLKTVCIGRRRLVDYSQHARRQARISNRLARPRQR